MSTNPNLTKSLEAIMITAALVRFVVQSQCHQPNLPLKKFQVETLLYGNENLFSY